MKTLLVIALFTSALCGQTKVIQGVPVKPDDPLPFCSAEVTCFVQGGCRCRARPEKQFVPAIQLPNAKDDDAICVDFFKDDPEKTRRCHKAFEQWTCADKRRVLLTSEDSTIHVCMKVQP